MVKLGGFLGVFLFPFPLRSKGLLGAESAAAIASVLGLFVTIALPPGTKGKSWRPSKWKSGLAKNAQLPDVAQDGAGRTALS
jgi:hypothetical protein